LALLQLLHNPCKILKLLAASKTVLLKYIVYRKLVQYLIEMIIVFGHVAALGNVGHYLGAKIRLVVMSKAHFGLVSVSDVGAVI
jgi:hypothetical protein